jgi:F-type H+-transporting ATPase subunit gamma
MPALIDIRRRIRSVKSTQQITKAMKMVSAAKLRRAQEAMFAARPYARKMLEVLDSLAARAPEAHPLLQQRGAERILAVVVTGDKGLCGAFNANILRTVQAFLKDRRSQDISLDVVGRKARDFFRRRSVRIRSEYVGVFQSSLKYATAQKIAKEVIQAFVNQEIDEAWIVYNEFKSVIQQRIVARRLLPVEREASSAKEPALDYLYEPGAHAIFQGILPKYVEVQIWQALLESAAAEHGARMAAMDSASNNAADVIERLTLYMNKVRQAAITKEIIEVVSGAGSPA